MRTHTRSNIAAAIALLALAEALPARAEFETTGFLRQATILMPPSPFATCLTGDVSPGPGGCEPPGGH